MSRILAVIAVLGAWLGAAGPAQAAWHRAETEHLVVYGNLADFHVKDFAVRLATFDAVLRAFNPPPAKATTRKLDVYVVRHRRDFQRVRPGLSEGIAGFYASSRDGIFAMATSEGDLAENDILFHEYAHHYMHQYFPAAYPAWFVEGWAEYFMTTEIKRDSVIVGKASAERSAWLLNATWLPLEAILSKATDETDPRVRSLFYAQAWLLTHYMRSAPDRADQLNRITAAIANGENGIKAFEAATGLTTDQLSQRLRGYRSLPAVQLKGFAKAAPAVTMTTLPASADEMLMDWLRLNGASAGAPDAAFLAEVRSKAARYPGDRLAELTLARAEFLWGDVAAAETIVARRLKADPREVETLTVAGLGQINAGLRERAQRPARFRTAREHLKTAAELDTGDYRPLLGYAISRTVEPEFPNNNDMMVLLEARRRAPSVTETALLAGEALLVRNDPEDARKVLAPLANDPHGGGAAQRAKALLASAEGALSGR